MNKADVSRKILHALSQASMDPIMLADAIGERATPELLSVIHELEAADKIHFDAVNKCWRLELPSPRSVEERLAALEAQAHTHSEGEPGRWARRKAPMSEAEAEYAAKTYPKPLDIPDCTHSQIMRETGKCAACGVQFVNCLVQDFGGWAIPEVDK